MIGVVAVKAKDAAFPKCLSDRVQVPSEDYGRQVATLFGHFWLLHYRQRMLTPSLLISFAGRCKLNSSVGRT